MVGLKGEGGLVEQADRLLESLLRPSCPPPPPPPPDVEPELSPSVALATGDDSSTGPLTTFSPAAATAVRSELLASLGCRMLAPVPHASVPSSARAASPPQSPIP